MTGHSNFQIAVINPGGTSTKVAYFIGEEEVFSIDIRHEKQDLEPFSTVFDQQAFRLTKVKDLFNEQGIDCNSLSAVVGRGGPLAPVPSGTYLVDEPLLQAIREGLYSVEHPSLLGAPMAASLAQLSGCPAYIVDPVSMDEFTPESRVTGLPTIERRALSHALSIKAAGREAAKQLGKKFCEANLIVLHLGSGFTVAVSQRGSQVDSTDASSSGPLSPTRAGVLPSLELAKLCFSGRYTLKDVEKLLVGKGGWIAHLGTDDIREIFKRMDDGDQTASIVMEATFLQLAKETAGMAAVLGGQVDAIVFTGGVARSDRFVELAKKRLAWLSPAFVVLPGECEMRALAQGAIRALSGEAPVVSMGPYFKKLSKEHS